MNLTPLKKALLLLTAPLFFAACNSVEEKESTTTWIGGEIVNPKSQYVLLSKGNFVIDTLALDNKNFFMFNSDSLSEGLYFFYHHEYQSFYVQPGDSLLLRVNTIDFDESLSYSGRGAARNNLLMELFLMDEREGQLVSSWYQLPPKVYEKNLDSLTAFRKELYNEYLLEHRPDEKFKEFVNARIDYDHYTKKEYYTTVNTRNGNAANIPESFYDFRKSVDYGNENLRFFYAYYKFFNPHFDNLVFQSNNGKKNFDKYSADHNKKKLDMVNTMISNDSLKNNLLRSVTRKYLLHENNAEKKQEIANLFLELNTSATHHDEINKLTEATIMLTPGNEIPDIMIVCSNNMGKSLRSIINKPTVLYFWSSRSMKHYQNIHTKASELKAKYPEYDFIGLNTDTHFKQWRAVVIKAGFNKAYEYQFDNVTEAQRKLVLNSVNKAFIVDEDGVIMESNTNLFNKDIETQLLGYLN